MRQKHLYFTGERIIPELENYFFREHLARYRLVKQYIKGDEVLLDIGCGDGYGTFYLSSYVRKAIGIDVSEEVTSMASNKYRRENLNFLKVHPDQWPFVDSLFDVVTCFEVFEHIDEPRKLLDLIRRHLKSNGILIISTPNKDVFGEHLKIPYHVREYDLAEFVTILQDYFLIKKIFGQRNKKKWSRRWNFWVSKQAMRYPFILRPLNWILSLKRKKHLQSGYFERVDLGGNFFSEEDAANADYFVVLCQRT